MPRRLLADPSYVRAHAILDEPDTFDSAFFGISPAEADLMDPQHRLMLECAWHALEDGGYDPTAVPGRVGIFGGGYRNDYLHRLPPSDDHNVQFVRNLANEPDYLVTRVAYKLNLTGPAVTVQAACATSLVAVHTAVEALRTGGCDVAVAGGITVRAGQYPGYRYQRGGILSPDGHCRAFDADAEGTVLGDGVGLVVLKRLADALADGDPIRAVVKGSAAGNDGADRVGFTAPGVAGQARIVAAALADAGTPPDTVTYVETHGSATPLGDRIEVDALNRAFRAAGWRGGACAIGSVKTNIGHTHAAAGIAGLIKTVLALEHGQLPPSLFFQRPNPRIDFANSPFAVNTQLREWPRVDGPRRAGVSSFGMGGTGVHVVIEEPPAQAGPVPGAAAPPARSWHVLTLSAKTARALDAGTDALAGALSRTPASALPAVAHTLQAGRAQLDRRRAVVARDPAEAAEALSERDPRALISPEATANRRPVAFMLPGVGDQYPQLGRDLYDAEPLFRDTVVRCADFLRERYDVDLLAALYPDGAGGTGTRAPDGQVDLRRMLRRGPAAQQSSQLDDTRLSQPAMFVLEYAVAKLWMSWGVTPAALIGYSIGEYVAACLSGVMTLEDGLTLVAERARLIHDRPAGAMLAVPLPEPEVQRLLAEQPGTAFLAAVNGPALCVVSGTTDRVAELQHRLGERGVPARQLQTTHPFHTPLLEPIAEPITRLVEGMSLRAPEIPYLSNVTGDFITAEDLADPRYWARHMCGPVRFTDGVRHLWQRQGIVLLELGPGQALGSFALQARPADADGLVLGCLPAAYDGQPAGRAMATAAARMWATGVDLDWAAYQDGRARRRLRLPTYRFEPRRHGVDLQPPEDMTPAGRPAERATAAPGADEPDGHRVPLRRKPRIDEWFSMPVWQPLPPRAPRPAAGDGSAGPAPGGTATAPPRTLLLVDGADDWLAPRVRQRLSDAGHEVVLVTAGDELCRHSPDHFSVDPASTDQCASLLADVHRDGRWPARIVHLWLAGASLTGATAAAGADAAGTDRADLAEQRGFASLLALAQAVGRMGAGALDGGAALEVSVVTAEMFPVAGGASDPEQATVLGPARVWPQENPRVRCRVIDIAALDPADRTGGRIDRAVQVLVDEILADADAPTGELVVLRGAQRWRRGYAPVELGAGTAGALRPRGAYLITGGLGGVGLTLARTLAERVQARLVLVGRTALPPRAAWVDQLASNGTDDPTSARIRQLQLIESAGGEVLVLAADVADPAQLRSAVDQARRHFGEIHGVFHAAGVPGAGLIQLKDLDQARQVLAPKVRGGRAVVDACAGVDLDFLVLFSSTLGLTGGLGQVDYCAANAYLDALAWQQQEAADRYTVAIDWDAWQEVGMAVAAAADQRVPTGHPLLGTRLVDTGSTIVYATRFHPRDTWLIDEHRMLGHPVVPGTGQLELARAAYEHATGAGQVRIHEIRFFTPIVFGADEEKEVRVILTREGAGMTYTVVSRGGPDGGWCAHSTGRLSGLAESARERVDIEATIAENGLAEIGERRSGPMGFGGRSRCLRRVWGNAEVFLAELELPEAYAPELDRLALHPSLLDLATAFAGLHVAAEFRIPISYGGLAVKAPLTRRMYSLMRYRDRDRPGKETLSADVILLDEHGEELVRIEEFVLKRTHDLATRLVSVRDGTAPDTVPYRHPQLDDGAGDYLREHLDLGLRPAEGMEALLRILARRPGPQMVVATKDLDAIFAQVSAAAHATAGVSGGEARRAGGHPRPNLLTAYVEPRTELERRLAGVWSGLLGVDRIGIHDHFFELGGHSLLGLQLAGRLQEEFGVDVPLGVLFDALTVAELAGVVERKGEV